MHSGMCMLPVLNRIVWKRRKQPGEACELLKRRGMDLAAVTDHNSIDAVESWRGRRVAEDLRLAEAPFAAVETHDRRMPGLTNRSSEIRARRAGKIAVTGSDAHALPAPGSTYTVIVGGRTRREYFEGLRRDRVCARGESCSPWKRMREAASIGWAVLRELLTWMLLMPLHAAVPLFVRKWTRRFRAGTRSGGGIARPLAPAGAWEMLP
jgi:hypothetical protein